MLLALCFPSPSAAHLVGPLGQPLALMQSLSVPGADGRNSFRSPRVSFWRVSRGSQGRALCPHGWAEGRFRVTSAPSTHTWEGLPAEPRCFPGGRALPSSAHSLLGPEQAPPLPQACAFSINPETGPLLPITPKTFREVPEGTFGVTCRILGFSSAST